MRFARAIAGLVLLCGCTLQALAADWTYTVRPGDDLWRLAANYCGSASYATRLAKHNNLARPQDIKAGERLRFPVDWLIRYPAEVEVKSVSGTVVNQDGKAYAARDRIMMGERVITKDGFAVVIFADGSTMEIGKNSEVLFNILTSYGETGMVDTHLRFYRGRGAVRVEKRPAPSKFRIWTPSGIAAVRGTDFRVGTLEEASRVETVTGAVDFDKAQQVIALPAGFGVIASDAGVSKEPLLPAPVVRDAGRPLWQPNQMVRWSADPKAREYRVKLYRQEPGGLRPLRSVSQHASDFDLAGIGAGEYAFSVRAVAHSGLEGFDTQFPLTMGALAPVADETTEFLRGDTLRWVDTDTGLQGGYEIQVATADSFADARGYTSSTAALALSETRAAQPGYYYWRVRRPDSAYSDIRQITVRPAPLNRIAVRKQGWQTSSNSQTLEVSWQPRAQEQYALNVYRYGDLADSNPVYSADVITAGRHETAPLPPGNYRVDVAAIAGGVSSATSSDEVRVVKPTSWWWAALLAVPLLFAL